MRLGPVLIAATLTWLPLGLTSAPASACSCARPDDAATALAAAHTVFEGRVVQVNPENAQAAQPAEVLLESERADLSVADQVGLAGGLAENWVPMRMLYRFEVLRSWKGNPTKLVTIETNSQSTACGRTYERDQRYLIYAYAGTEGRLADNSCTRSAPSSKAGKDIVTLDAISAATSPPAQPATTDTQLPEPVKEAPAAAPAQSPDSTETIDPVESSPSCALSGTERNPNSSSWPLLLLLAGSVLIRRQRP